MATESIRADNLQTDESLRFLVEVMAESAYFTLKDLASASIDVEYKDGQMIAAELSATSTLHTNVIDRVTVSVTFNN